eukprot:833731-Heterocapsa_arctica.AAC.1
MSWRPPSCGMPRTVGESLWALHAEARRCYPAWHRHRQDRRERHGWHGDRRRGGEHERECARGGPP